MPDKPSALVLEPHQDDCALFCAFNAIRHRAHIVCVTASTKEREDESAWAAAILGCTFEQWLTPVESPDWEAVRSVMRHYDANYAPGVVFAPALEVGGHEQHNAVSVQAAAVFGDRVTYYTTYRPGGPRTTGAPVEFEREWVLRKLRALACFESQILSGPVRFFTHALDEWTRP